MLKKLGDRLRNAREKMNFSQVDVSKLTGISNKTISNYENNVSSPDPETLRAFADLYKTSVDYLLGRTEFHNLNETIYESETHYLDVSDLPVEAIKQVEEYIELIKLKYTPGKNRKNKPSL